MSVLSAPAVDLPASAEPAPIIELTGVQKTYDTGSVTFQALRGIDMTVAESDYVAIMGPSGSGKSTLMHILGCLDVPTTGRYRLAGVDVGSLDEGRLAEIRNRRMPAGTSHSTTSPVRYPRTAVPIGARTEIRPRSASASWG